MDSFQTALLKWFQTEQHTLPWREANHPYEIWISEIMLQLPGIGPYTAGAISSIAHNCDVPMVDANIERIFARLFNIDLIQGSPRAKRVNWQQAEQILPQGRAGDCNHALMELGALICRPKNPNCTLCPIADHCLALRYDMISVRPVPKKSQKIIPIEMATGLLVHKGNIFIQQRLADDVWGSLWEFPGGRRETGETPRQTVIREFMEETEFRVQVKKKLTITIHHYTKYKVTLHCFLVSLDQEVTDPVLHAAQEFHWLPFKELRRKGILGQPPRQPLALLCSHLHPKEQPK